MWSKVSNIIKKEIGDSLYNTWFHSVSMNNINDSGLTLNVPNVFYKDHIENHYLDIVKKAAKTVSQKDTAVFFIISEQKQEKIILNNDSEYETKSTIFNPKFSFNNFIVGSSNSFAHAVCMAVAESPGHAYNPLFIYGKVGLGKTHLMQSIGLYIQEQSPEKTILYISSEKFTNELINALKNKTTEKFRDKYRNIDVLLIDDIQFIAGKETTQEEFFHTFNHLHNSNRQIVISSDRPPKEISKLEERLISRFEWGITADVQTPDFETRMAILRKKAEKMLMPIPNEVIEFIAFNFKSNIRELEGALTRVVALSSLSDQTLSLAIAKETLKDSISLKEKFINIESIQKVVADHFDLSINDLKSAKRSKTIVYPRQVAMYLCRKITNSSFPEIGDKFGGRDHTTVMHSCEKITNNCDSDSSVRASLHKLEEKIVN